MSAEGKSCFKCDQPLTREDLKKIVYWANTTKSDFGLRVKDSINFPDDEAVVCYQCLNKLSFSALQTKYKITRR